VTVPEPPAELAAIAARVQIRLGEILAAEREEWAALDPSLDEPLGDLADSDLATNVGGGAAASDDGDPNTDDNTATVTITDNDDDDPTTVPAFLVSNFGQANSGTGNHQSHDHAQAFTTGPNPGGYTLTAVDFLFPQVNDGGLAAKMTVTVNSDNSGAPGGVVATLTKPATITVGTNTFTHAGLQLEANTTYWAVIDNNGQATGSANQIQNTASDGEDAGGTDEMRNLQTLCRPCHIDKTRRENVKHPVIGQEEWAGYV